ncbi:MAG TPA: response regulator transcription factor [Amycolatopsis sp.]|jgi:DNA-binding NarL/FixJ family response regulator|nr:response regulator transcription factor [Amycolatopsis sp.]
MTIKVFLVDDQPLIRSGIRMVLSSQSDIAVIGEAIDGADALRQLGHLRPDVVLMDVRMPGVDGIEATERLLRKTGANQDNAEPAARVIVLTTFDTDENALAALRAGASGFLLKTAQPEAIIEAVRVVHRGDAVIAPSTTRRLLQHLGPSDRSTTSNQREKARRLVASLTARETEVLTLIASGRTNPEIAETLFVTNATVKTHVGNILDKLGSRDRVQAVITAYEAGLASS